MWKKYSKKCFFVYNEAVLVTNAIQHMVTSPHNQKEIIGRLEYVDLPDFNLQKIIAKIDTGAYSGAIHTDYIKEYEKDGKKIIEFSLLDDHHPEFKNTIYTLNDFDVKKIKSSSGKSELRYIIPVTIVIKNKTIKAKLSLSNRKAMRYPILLGRKFINNLFIIDASKKFTD